MSTGFKHFDNWETLEHPCKCGRSGTVRKGDIEIYDALGGFDFPGFCSKLLAVSWPTEPETAVAAAKKNP